MLNNIHERTGYRADVLEKDYYVVLVLEELAGKQRNGLKAYFKGGTALYKALGIMQKQYVLQESGRIDYSHAADVLFDINTKLRMNSAWIKSSVSIHNTVKNQERGK